MGYKRLLWKHKRGTSQYEFDDTWESVVECRCPHLIYQVKFIITKDPNEQDFCLEVMSDLVGDIKPLETYQAPLLDDVQKMADKINARLFDRIHDMLIEWTDP